MEKDEEEVADAHHHHHQRGGAVVGGGGGSYSRAPLELITTESLRKTTKDVKKKVTIILNFLNG